MMMYFQQCQLLFCADAHIRDFFAPIQSIPPNPSCVITLFEIFFTNVIQYRAHLANFAQIRSLHNLQQNSIFMAYGVSNICVIQMEKQTHSTLVLVVPAEFSDFVVLTQFFCKKKGVNRSIFVLPLFPRGRGGGFV